MGIVTVNKNTYTVDPVYQWDTNQELAIYGLSLTGNVEIHFTNTASKTAIISPATINDIGVITAKIPNKLLRTPYDLRCYVCVEESGKLRSSYKIDIPVIPRAKPDEYIAVNDHNFFVISSLEKVVTDSVISLRADVEKIVTDSAISLKADVEKVIDDTVIPLKADVEKWGRPAKWYTGIEIDGEIEDTVFPNSGVIEAVAGDMYLNSDTGNVYKCTSGGRSTEAKWSFVMFMGSGTGGGVGGGSVQSTTIKLLNLNGTSTFIAPVNNDVDLKFSFTSTEDDVPTGDGVCKIFVGGSVKTTFSITQGEHTVNVKDYLAVGENTVRVTCMDIYGNSRSLTYTITTIELKLTSTFDDSVIYTGNIPFKYRPYGLAEKTIHFVVDGTEVKTAVTTKSGVQDTVTFDAMPHGVHTLEVYITATVEGVDLESDSILFDIMCVEAENKTAFIASPFVTDSVSQGELVSIPYSLYDPLSDKCEITLTVKSGSEIYSQNTITVDRTRQHWNTRRYPVGDVTFIIAYGDISVSHTVTVVKNNIDVEAVSNDLELFLSSAGRSNNEKNPAIWENNGVSTSFEGFNWKSTGWIQDENGDVALRFNGDAKAVIDFKPFSTDLRVYGKTIELEFAIRDVNNRDAVVISCVSGNIGIDIKADVAELSSEQSAVNCRYRDEKKIRVAFVIESRSEYRLMSIYLNGHLSGAKQYPNTDNFQQSTPVSISLGSEYCGLDLYTVRVYNTALTDIEVNDNYIADTTNIGDKIALHESNDIYDAYNNISSELVKEKIPVMIITGALPQSKGDKKDVKIKFENCFTPALNFEDECSIDVQGTSSQWYRVKNYKLKCTEPHQHAIGQIATKVFCMKADYAEATGTHNTQNANFVETLYSSKTPAQKLDNRCRTTIYGFPCVIFHQATESDDLEFIGKYNFNFDKGSEEVFGFTSDYDVECWEFCNNTSDACNFKASIPTNWGDDFESRYPDGNKDISRFKKMHSWVVSTANDLDKFKAEFENYFNLEYMLIYYVYTFFALMVDQRAKNMFMTYWADTGKWEPWFYDNDTCFGINNEGQLIFDYYHEDTDTYNGANVYNGQDSVLWNNFRLAYADEIKTCYQNLRNSGKLTYDALIDKFITNGSRKWSATIYNEDAEVKYLSMLREDNDATNLGQIRGSGEDHLEYIVDNRLKYCDSKWYASDYADNYIVFRIYTPETYAGVEPNADITITPFSNMYAGVRYKANGTLQQERVTKNEPITFNAPEETFNDTETAVYGASEISSLGDMAPLYCGYIDLSPAEKLIDIKIGDATEGYCNSYLNFLSVGTNTLLKKIDVQNCPNLTDPLGLTGCPNIEEIYAKGSGITGVDLGNSGYLKVIQLPGTITNLTLKNQLYIEDLTIEGYDNLKTLCVENCPTVDELDIISKATALERLRLVGVNWSYETASELLAWARLGYAGLDENGTNIDNAYVSGTCHIATLTGSEMLEIKSIFPYVAITYDSLLANLVFMNEDGTTELTRQILKNGADGTDPIETEGISTPTKDSTAQYEYIFAGWSTEIGGEVDPDALKNVEYDRYLYPVFTATVRIYTVRFFNGDILLQTSSVVYGEIPVYTEEEPKTTETDYIFNGWIPKLSPVVRDIDYVANFKYKESIARMIVNKTITDFSNDDVTLIGTYAFANCVSLTNVNIPSITFIGSSAFYGCKSLMNVHLPEIPPSIDITNGISGSFSGISNTCVFYVPTGFISAYQADQKWSTLMSTYSFVEEDR